jgi:hypothetical protein
MRPHRLLTLRAPSIVIGWLAPAAVPTNTTDRLPLCVHRRRHVPLRGLRGLFLRQRGRRLSGLRGLAAGGCAG